MYVCIPLSDIRCTAFAFGILLLPGDGYTRWPKHTGAQKLSFMQ